MPRIGSTVFIAFIHLNYDIWKKIGFNQRTRVMIYEMNKSTINLGLASFSHHPSESE